MPMPSPEGRNDEKPRQVSTADMPKPAFGAQAKGKPTPRLPAPAISSDNSGEIAPAKPAAVSVPQTAAPPVLQQAAARIPGPDTHQLSLESSTPLAPPGLAAFHTPVLIPLPNFPHNDDDSGAALASGEAAGVLPVEPAPLAPAMASANAPPIRSTSLPASEPAPILAESEEPEPPLKSIAADADADQDDFAEAFGAPPAVDTTDAVEQIAQAETAETAAQTTEPASRVRAWDFATGVPLPPVASAEPGTETNDNPDTGSTQPQLAAEADALTPATVEEAAAAAPLAEPAAELASDQSVARDLGDAGDASTPAGQTGEATSATKSQPGARIWDFATGQPITPELEPAQTAETGTTDAGAELAQAPAAAEAETGDATPALAQASTQAAAPAKPAEAARVWDFRTGMPIDATAGLSGDSEASPATSLASYSAEPPILSPQDELILELRVKGVDAADTIIAYGTSGGIYLPLGTVARILDLAISVSDDGHYAHGWILEEDQILSIDLRQGLVEFEGKQQDIPGSLATAYEGELYLRIDQFERFFPLKATADLRSMAILIETLQPFPFQLRAEREARREQIAARQGRPEGRNFERVDLPWRALSVPAADIEIRAVSDDRYGPRLEGDLRLAGDLGYLTAEAYLSGETENGLTASLLELGRVDPDGDMLGPLGATAFSIGDISTESMPMGLRSVSGRGFTVTNAATQLTSVFDRVDLRGILPAGYEVELYRNDVLIGSTREAVNGQYEFLQVPVDFGLNVFRLVFFGPQGQRSESVRRISVGDGRVAEGDLVYNMSAAQRDRNLLGVTPPNFVPSRNYGDWRVGGQLAYGVTSGLTALLSGSWFESENDSDRWVSSAGLRTSVNGIAVKADVGIADGGAMAFGGGLGGRIGRSAVTLSHAEYSGLYPDETKAAGLQFLRRATELDFNTTLELGNPATGLVVPLSARVRNYVDVDGRSTLQAGLRASTRTSGLLLSNTLEYSRTSAPDFETNAQLFGNFDLATMGRSDTRVRLSLGYEVAPELDVTNAGFEIDHALDERTSLRASANYAFSSKTTTLGMSAVREFDRFSLALDGNYTFSNDAYYVGLRLGFSLGRDPLSKRVFMDRPGQATSGGATLRAFQDLDGDGLFGPSDKPLPEVDFIAFNQTATTDTDGVARLGGLGTGRGVGVQIDPTSLPDIDLAPAKPGVELVPRAGRFHAIDYPVVAMSEIEGTIRFVSGGESKGVSGVRLTLADESGKIVGIVKTELDGYYFFEHVNPGQYRMSIEPGQASRLNLCPIDFGTVTVGYESDIITRDLEIARCETEEPRIARITRSEKGPAAVASNIAN